MKPTGSDPAEPIDLPDPRTVRPMARADSDRVDLIRPEFKTLSGTSHALCLLDNQVKMINFEIPHPAELAMYSTDKF